MKILKAFPTTCLSVSVGFLLLLSSCNNPVSNATRYTSGPQVSGLPMGGGLTVYVGMVNKDSYRTGLLVYPNGGSQWNQLLSTAATVNDINIDSSGNIAVAEPNLVLYYQKSSTSWSSAATAGIANQVSFNGSGALYASTSQGFKSWTWAASTLTGPTAITVTDLGSDQNTISLSYSSGSFYVGTLSGLNKSNGVAAGTLFPSGAVNSSSINGVFAVGSNVYVATSAGFSYSLNSGSTWTDIASSAIGLGTPLCVYYYNGTVYLGAANGVATSTDNGVTWNGTNLATPVYSIAAATANGNTSIYAATPAGLYIKSSGSSVVQSGWSVVFSGYGVNKVAVTVP